MNARPGQYSIVICISFGILFLSACANQAERLWLKAPDWSRAEMIGNTRIGDPVPMAVNESGAIFLFYITPHGDQSILRLTSLDNSGTMLWSREYADATLIRPSGPLIFSEEGSLRLFWISDCALYTATVDEQGEYLSRTRVISGRHIVEEFDVSMSPEGEFGVWFSSPPEQPGLYGLLLSEGYSNATLIDAQGTGAEIQFDEAGKLHALWARNPSPRGANPFVYGEYTGGRPQTGQDEVVVSPIIFGTTSLDGPHLGLDDDHVYVFWSLTYFSGQEAGTTEAYYEYFPRGNPSAASTESLITIPWEYELEYRESNGYLQSGRRVSLAEGYFGGGTYILQITPNNSYASELVVTLYARISYLMRKVQGQVNAIYISDGVPTGYQQLSFSPSNSTTPALYSDDHGYLYLTWLEKGELPGWVIYFASTSPEVKENLASLTTDDIGRLSAETLFGMVSGALLIPLALAWVLPSSIVMVLISRSVGTILRRTSVSEEMPIIAAIIISWVIKVGVLPGILDYVPFSIWIPAIPPWLDLPLRIFVPFIIAVVGWITARMVIGHKPAIFPYRFFFLYSVGDALLTMSVYGVLIVVGF